MGCKDDDHEFESVPDRDGYSKAKCRKCGKEEMPSVLRTNDSTAGFGNYTGGGSSMSGASSGDTGSE